MPIPDYHSFGSALLMAISCVNNFLLEAHLAQLGFDHPLSGQVCRSYSLFYGSRYFQTLNLTI